jgi:hypothetical protein
LFFNTLLVRWLQRQVVFLHLLVEQGAVDSEDAGGARFLEAGLFQGQPDGLALVAGLQLAQGRLL